ncbi:MAG: bifunctional folylpolyglutamate synthase/dihydrofolate synthase, partial [Pseudomonadota bacterium]|nr:bifunctional folylpolyglutamate synthase/dihydrofolate synthase [Pseudomonadota bacterium]
MSEPCRRKWAKFRLDSTNTIDAEVAVVTNIGLEHTAILGSAHAAIAREKAGILKSGAVLITAVAPTSEAGSVLQEIALSLGCAVTFVPTTAEMAIRVSNVRLAGAVLDAVGHMQLRRRPTKA